MSTFDSQPTSVRVALGKELEEKVLRCLNEDYAHHGYNLFPSTFVEDCEEKTDCWQVTKSGKKYRSAIKVRKSKNDILVCMRDPFYGVNHSESVVGRDMLYEYFQYITLSKDGSTIRVASGKAIHLISNVMWEEFLDEVGDIDITRPPYNRGGPVKLLSSKMYPGCEMWLHFDRWKGQPKILGFVPTNVLKPDKEIKFHKFIER